MLGRSPAGRRIIERYERIGPRAAVLVRRIEGDSGSARWYLDQVAAGLNRIDCTNASTGRAVDTIVRALDLLLPRCGDVPSADWSAFDPLLIVQGELYAER